jgi:hypothetical protein
MPIPQTHLMERLSESFASSIIARAGAKYEFTTQDYGTDAIISSVEEIHGKLTSTHHFRAQLKGTTQWRLNGNTIHFPRIDATAYNRIADDPSLSPNLFLFVAFPKDCDAWLTWEPDHIIHRLHCYYYQPQAPTTNTKSVSVKINTDRAFTPAAVHHILNAVRSRKYLGKIIVP